MSSRPPSGRLKWILWLVVLPLLLFAGYLWLMLTWSYSEGERAGYVQKLSKRGWLCKTWEGELALVTMPGTVAEKFTFTVRDDGIAEQINLTLGKRVSLDYEQHVGLPTSCFGDTPYFATGVRIVDEPTLSPQAGAGPAAMPEAAPSVLNPSLKGADVPGITLDHTAIPPAAGSTLLPDAPPAAPDTGARKP
jgi:hypothetical protein